MIVALLLVLLVFVFVFGIVYLLVGIYQATSPIEEDTAQDDFLWGEGYAFATLKIKAADYDDLPRMVKKTKEEFDKLRGFSVIVCTRDHGDYLSQRMKPLERPDERTHKFNVMFGKALGTTVVERFIILYDQQEIVSDGFEPSHQYPVEFSKGDTLEITHTLRLLETE